MTTIFTHIIEGRIPGTFVYRDDLCVAFMTINPIAPGHVLVVPITEINEWTELSTDLSVHIFSVSSKIAKVMRTAFNCERVGLIIAGFEVDHCHVHLIPTRSMADLDFKNAAHFVERTELEEHAKKIIAAL